MRNKTNNPIEDEALMWLMRSTSGEFSQQQARQLEQWLAQSEAHRQAYEEAKQLWQGLGALRDSPVIAKRAAKDHQSNINSQPRPCPERKPNLQIRHFSLAALACFALLIFTLLPHPNIPAVWFADHRTSVGEQQTLTLTDGSIVYLNSASAFNTDFDVQQRRIELLTGEAEFVVAKNPNRPFIVVAGDQEVTALGTDFIVRKQQSSVSITVIESAVKISQSNHSDLNPVVLHPGQSINTEFGQTPDEIVYIDTDRAQAWRRNQLIFENETLSNVVAEINRYRPGHVFLSSQAAENKVSGVFRIDQIDKVLAVIDQTLPVKSVNLPGRYVVLY